MLLDTEDLYYNTQVYFRHHILETLPNDDRVWRDEYHAWLKSQGAVIVKDHNLRVLTNSLGVSPGYDKFGFKNEQDATLFILRWA